MPLPRSGRAAPGLSSSPSSSPSAPPPAPSQELAAFPAASAAALSSAERRALSLAQREAEREALQERRRAARSVQPPQSRAEPSGSLPLLAEDRKRSAAPTGFAPPLPSLQSASSASLSVRPWVPLLSPSTSSRRGPLSAAEQAEQLALIDELTDYVRSFRQPRFDLRSAAALSLRSPPTASASASISAAEFFFARPETTASYNQFITNHALHSAVDAGLAVQAVMRRKGIAEDEKTYTALVQVCGAVPPSTAEERRGELAERAAALLEEMKARGLLPSLRLFNALLETWTRLGAVERALTVPALLQEHALAPSAATFTSLLSLYREPSVSWPQLRGFWSALRHAGASPDVVAFNAAIRAAAHHGEAEFALQLHAQMQHSGLQPSAFTYNALMYACAKRGDFQLKAFDLYAEAMAAQFAPDSVMLSTLLYACARHGHLTNAIEVFKQMEKAGVARDTIAYNTMLQCIANSQTQGTAHGLTRQQRMDMADALLIQMEATHVPIDDRTVYLALRVWTTALRLRVAERKREELVQRYVAVPREQQRAEGRGDFSARLWTLLLDMFCTARRVDECKRVLERMDGFGLHAGQRSLDGLLRLAALRADATFGRSVVERMTALGLRPRSAEHERLFDERRYREWHRAQRALAMEGAVPAMAEGERQRLRERSWIGARPPTAEKGRSEEARRPWWPSHMERRARDRELRVRRRREKTLQQESVQ